MRIITNEERMLDILKTLLSLQNEGHWKHYTTKDKLDVFFKGDMDEVKKELLKWLSVEDRVR